MVKGLLNEYLKAQRNAILQERKLELEAQKQFDRKQQQLKEAQKYYLETQIQMLQEELQDTKAQEAILQREAAQEMRRLVREQKDFGKRKISLLHRKLEADESHDIYRQQVLQELQQVNFKMVPRRT